MSLLGSGTAAINFQLGEEMGMGDTLLNGVFSSSLESLIPQSKIDPIEFLGGALDKIFETDKMWNGMGLSSDALSSLQSPIGGIGLSSAIIR